MEEKKEKLVYVPENNPTVGLVSALPGKCTFRKTGEEVEVIASNIVEHGARSEEDWVSYIDSNGEEHIKEHLNIQFDFRPIGMMDWLDKLMKPLQMPEPVKFPEFDSWEIRRYELAKQLYVERHLPPAQCAELADEFIAVMKTDRTRG